jgi:hypothetical protein
MTGGFDRLSRSTGFAWGVLLLLATGQSATAHAQSVRLAAGSSADVTPTNEPRAHLRNLSNAVWSKSMESETPTRAPIRLISRYTRYPFGQYGVHGRYPFGTPYYSYGPSLGERSYGQYPVPRPAPPTAIAAPLPPWVVGGGYGPGVWGYGWNGYGYGAYDPVTWSYGGWGAAVPPGWGYVPVAPVWGPGPAGW